MALAIAEAGADVVLAGRDEKSLQATADEIKQRGRAAFPLQADIGDPEQCQAACEQVVSELGPIDILVNNVGGRRENIPTEQMSLGKWRELMDLNLTSTFLCTRIVGAAMIERGEGGRIINISSINSIVVGRRIAGRHYETAKAAIVQFTRAVAADWAPHKITVNAICPGGFMTEPNQRWAREHPEVIEAFREQIPMGDFGQPEDLGPLAVYLASDASRYMTGASLIIDGGYTLW
jgi:NAD(P)-dependent dehydrogenase (short-subunit alcohol dehydrogenase family)